MPNCIVPGCYNRYGKTHRLPNPAKDMERFEKWIQVIGNPRMKIEDRFKIFNNRRICHMHFKPSDLISNDRLSNTAIPSLNLNASRSKTIPRTPVCPKGRKAQGTTNMEVKEILIKKESKKSNSKGNEKQQEIKQAITDKNLRIKKIIKSYQDCLSINKSKFLDPTLNKNIFLGPSVIKNIFVDVENTPSSKNTTSPTEISKDLSNSASISFAEHVIDNTDSLSRFGNTFNENLEITSLFGQDSGLLINSPIVNTVPGESFNSNVRTESRFENSCRLCAISIPGIKFPVFSDNMPESNEQKINFIFPFTVAKNDGLPQYLCETCQDKIDSIYTFVKDAIDCDKKFKNEINNPNASLPDCDLSEAKSASNNRGFSCDVCGKKFKYKQALISHAETHIQAPLSMDVYECSYCGETFFQNFHQSSKFIQHMCYTKLNKISGNCFYNCELCDSFFTDKSKLVAHKNKHIDKHKFLCSLCDVRSDDYANISIHRKTHSEKMKVPEIYFFLCEICEKSYKSYEYLSTHYKLKHPSRVKPVEKEKPPPTLHTCPTCKKIFSSNGALQLHIKTKHLILACNICEMTFDNKPDLVEHKEVHKNESPKFQCYICATIFSKQCILTTHMKSHNLVLVKIEGEESDNVTSEENKVIDLTDL